MEQDKKEQEKMKRTIKLKTLDNNKMLELTVDSDINIKELKKIISEKFDNIAIERERLIFRGKQLKDNEKLSDHINKDNEIIHLMFKTIEQIQPNQTPTNSNTNNTNNNNNNNNSSQQNNFSNILNNLINNPAIINMTNMIVSNFDSNRGGLVIQREIPLTTNASSNNNQNPQSTNSNINNTNNIQRNIRTTTRVINLTTQNPNLNNQNNNQSINQNNNQNIRNNQNPNLSSSIPQQGISPSQNLNIEIEKMNENNPFPIQHSENDRKYEDILKTTNSKIHKSLKTLSKETPLVNLPLLNTTQNVLTAISRTLRYYILTINEILPNFLRLSELMEREQFLQDINDRKNANELLKKCTNSLSDFSQATESLKKILKAVNFGESPNTGYINVISTDFGVIATNSRGEAIEGTTLLSFNGPNPNPGNDNRVMNFGNTQDEGIVNNFVQQLINSEGLNNIVGGIVTGNGSGNGNVNITGNIEIPLEINLNQFGNVGNNTNMNVVNNNNMNVVNNNNMNVVNNNNMNIVNNNVSQNDNNIKKEEKKEKGIELLRKIMNDKADRKSIYLKDISDVAEMKPNKEFELFSKKILSHLTIEEIINLNSMNIIGFTRQRGEIQSLISDIPSSTKKLSELICERIILVENNLDKLIPDNQFDIEKFFNENLIQFIEILSNKNISDSEWDEKVKTSFLKIILNFYKELINIYETKEDGAKYCFEFNLETILNDLIGEDFIKILKEYNEDCIINFLENIISIAENTNFDDLNDNNNQLLLSMEEIFNIALRDKKKIELEENKNKEDKNKEENNKEENNNNEVNNNNEGFSEFYKKTSLFQN